MNQRRLKRHGRLNRNAVTQNDRPDFADFVNKQTRNSGLPCIIAGFFRNP